MYVDELIGPDTVNTLPPATIKACADHCDVANRVETEVEEAYQLIESLKDPDINIDINAVMDELLIEGIDKFVQPFQSLMNSLEEQSQAIVTSIGTGDWGLGNGDWGLGTRDWERVFPIPNPNPNPKSKIQNPNAQFPIPNPNS